MKSVQHTLLDRRSIRRYEREPVTADQMSIIYEAIRNTPTSYNGQQFSVIDIADQPLKEKLYGIIGAKQIKTCSHFLLFCADYHKIALAAADKGVEMPPFAHTMDGIIVGTVDASLAMMSAVVAAESLGLGTCCVGYARTAAPEELSRILGLPQGVYAVCGLAIGVPREKPDLKPKQPADLLVHPDHYSPDQKLLPLLRFYDGEIEAFNRTRSGEQTSNDWTAHIVGYYAEAMHYHMLEALRSQGFEPQR